MLPPSPKGAANVRFSFQQFLRKFRRRKKVITKYPPVFAKIRFTELQNGSTTISKFLLVKLEACITLFSGINERVYKKTRSLINDREGFNAKSAPLRWDKLFEAKSSFKFYQTFID